MTRNPISSILVDVDGTIISDKTQDHPAYIKGRSQFAQLIKLANQGEIPPIGFCTGREASYVLGMLRWLGLPDSFSVVESGLVLFNPLTQERLYNPAFTPELREIFDEVRRNRIPRLLEKLPYLSLYIGKEVNIALEPRPGAPSIEECRVAIEEELREVEGITINASGSAVDISPKGVDKGTGTLFYCKVTKTNPAHVLLIDDSLGGKPAADVVGYLGCASDAEGSFKELVLDRDKDKRHTSELPLVEGVVDCICHFTDTPVPIAQ